MAIKSIRNNMWGYMLTIICCLIFAWNISSFDCAENMTLSYATSADIAATFDSNTTNSIIEQSNRSSLSSKGSKKIAIVTTLVVAIVAAVSAIVVTYIRSKKTKEDPTRPKPEVDPTLKPKEELKPKPEVDPTLKPKEELQPKPEVDPTPKPKKDPKSEEESESEVESEEEDELTPYPEPKRSFYRQIIALCDALGIHDGLSLTNLLRHRDSLVESSLQEFLEEALQILQKQTFDDDVPKESQPAIQKKREELLQEVLSIEKYGDPEVLLVTANLLIRAAEKIENRLHIELDEFKELMDDVSGNDIIELEAKDYIEAVREGIKQTGLDEDYIEDGKVFIKIVDELLPKLIQLNNDTVPYLQKADNIMREDISSDMKLLELIKKEEGTDEQ